MSNIDIFLPFIKTRIGKGKTFITEYKLNQYKKFINGDLTMNMQDLSKFKHEMQEFIDEFIAEFSEQLTSLQLSDFVKCLDIAYTEKYKTNTGSKTFDALKNDLFKHDDVKVNKMPLLYENIPANISDGCNVYSIQVLIPYNGVYPGFPTLYCVTDDIKKHKSYIRKTYVTYIKMKYKDEVRRYSNTYHISVSHDIGIKKVKQLNIK